MMWIIITSPQEIRGEVNIIRQLIDEGADIVHLRKPSWDEVQTRRFLDSLDETTIRHMMLHDHHKLIKDYPLKGIHHNSRNPGLPSPQTHVTHSCACHTLEEVVAKTPYYDYVLMSPIFDSISKTGYRSNYTPEELCEASRRGIIGKKTIALGGITIHRLDYLRELGFGGAAFLGDLWQKVNTPEFSSYISALRRKLMVNK